MYESAGIEKLGENLISFVSWIDIEKNLMTLLM